MKLLQGLAVVLVVIALYLLVVFAFQPEASAAGTDTIVNVETHANSYGDQFIVVKPENWAQPVYGIWVTSACAATLSVGDAWPAC